METANPERMKLLRSIAAKLTRCSDERLEKLDTQLTKELKKKEGATHA